MSVRIGIDGTSLLGPRSGVGNYSARLLAALIAVQPEWEYLLYSNRPLVALEPALQAAQKVVTRLPSKRLFWMQCLLPSTIARSRPDLCHFPNAMAPLWQQTPFVLTIHDASLFLYRQFHPLSRLISIRLALPLLARRAAAVITVSHHARAELINVLDLQPEQVHVIHEAAPDHFAPVTDGIQLQRLQRKYGLPKQFLLYVGTLEPRKNLTRLVRALDAVRRHGYEHKLVLVGTAAWRMEPLLAEIERLGLQQHVIFTGYVPTADLPGLFSLASLFVFPSLHEGFGLPPLEAMACGAVVAASNRGAIPEVCGDAAHLFDPEQQESLDQALLTLLADDALCDALRARGREQARRFSWQQAARETVRVYSHALAPLPNTAKLEQVQQNGRRYG